MDIDSAFFGDVLQDGLAHGRAADVTQADDECGWGHSCLGSISRILLCKMVGGGCSNRAVKLGAEPESGVSARTDGKLSS